MGKAQALNQEWACCFPGAEASEAEVGEWGQELEDKVREPGRDSLWMSSR